MSGKGRLKVICIPDHFADRRPTPCGYVRLVLPLTKRISAQALDVDLAYFAWCDQDGFDALIAQRLALPTRAAIDKAVFLCRKRGAKFIYDIDDDLLSMAQDHSDSREFDGVRIVVRHALACADQVWVSTPELKQRYLPFANDVVVVPNALDARIWKPRPPVPSRDKELRFVYMGTTSHRADFFDIVEPAFRRLVGASKRKVSLSLIGIVPPNRSSDIWSSILPPPHGSIYPVFATWLQSLDRFDVGIAPLKDTFFNSAKSDIKWLEYSAMGLATIAAKLKPYCDTIRHGENGLLCAAHPDAWYDAMTGLVDVNREQIRNSAYEDVLRRLDESDATEPRIELLHSL